MMAAETVQHHYRPTESQFKGGAKEMYVTYDIEQKTRGEGHALYPKVKRVYIAGEVENWHAGQAKKRTGRQVHGVTIEYKQSRKGYSRKPYNAKRSLTAYKVGPATVKSSSQKFRKVVEIPEAARNVHFYADASKMPEKYRQALQDIR